MRQTKYQIRNTAPIPSAGPKYFCQLSLNFFVSFILPILLPQFMHFPLPQAFSMKRSFLSLCLHAIPVMASILTIQKFQQIRLLPASALHICPDFLRTADTLYLRHLSIFPADSRKIPRRNRAVFDRPDAHLTARQTIPCDKPRILKSQRISKPPQDSAWRRDDLLPIRQVRTRA